MWFWLAAKLMRVATITAGSRTWSRYVETAICEIAKCADTDVDAGLQLSGGEYIAVEKLESVYKSTSVVGEGMILANPQHRQPAMIVCIHHVNFPQFVKSQNLGGGSEDLDKLCRDKEVEKAVLRELNANGKKQGFSNLELLESVILTPDEW